MKKVSKESAEYIAILRRKKGYKQKEMAEKLYVSKTLYNYYETGKRSMPKDIYDNALRILCDDKRSLLESEMICLRARSDSLIKELIECHEKIDNLKKEISEC